MEGDGEENVSDDFEDEFQLKNLHYDDTHQPQLSVIIFLMPTKRIIQFPPRLLGADELNCMVCMILSE